MSKRSLAIATIALSFVATAAVAAALWPDRDPSDSSPEGTGARRVNAGSAPAVPAEDSPGDPSSTAVEEAREPVTEPLDDASEFSLQPIPVDPPVRPQLKRPPAGGLLFDVE